MRFLVRLDTLGGLDRRESWNLSVRTTSCPCQECRAEWKPKYGPQTNRVRRHTRDCYLQALVVTNLAKLVRSGR